MGDSVVRGRAPGSREAGSPSSSQNICDRLPRHSPSSGIVGELCSQPPLGVAEIMLPQRSTTSMWQVSPFVAPSRWTVGSPVVASRGASGLLAGEQAAYVLGQTRLATTGRPRAQLDAGRGPDQTGAGGDVVTGEQVVDRDR